VAAIALSAIGAGLIAWRLPDVKACILEEGPPGQHTRKILGQEQKDCFTVESAEDGNAWSREVIRLLVLSFLVYLAFNFFYVGFPMRAAGELAWSPVGLGLFFAFISLLMAGVQGLVLPWASRRWADPALVWGGGVVLASAFAFFAGEALWLLGMGALALALGNGLMWPSLQAVLSRAADGPHQGAVQGAAGSVAAVASILGLLLGGAAFTALGTRLFLLATAITAGVVLLSFGWVPAEE
jgi:MFS family permease